MLVEAIVIGSIIGTAGTILSDATKKESSDSRESDPDDKCDTSDWSSGRDDSNEHGPFAGNG